MSDAPPFPPEVLIRIAQRLKALGDPTRLQVLQLLGEGELCVGELVDRVGGTQANVSKHLAVLRSAGLVRPRREGMNVYYAVEDQAALEVCRLMCRCVERDAERTMAELAQLGAGSPPRGVARRAPAAGIAARSGTGTARTSS